MKKTICITLIILALTFLFTACTSENEEPQQANLVFTIKELALGELNTFSLVVFTDEDGETIQLQGDVDAWFENVIIESVDRDTLASATLINTNDNTVAFGGRVYNLVINENRYSVPIIIGAKLEIQKTETGYIFIPYENE